MGKPQLYSQEMKCGDFHQRILIKTKSGQLWWTFADEDERIWNGPFPDTAALALDVEEFGAMAAPM